MFSFHLNGGPLEVDRRTICIPKQIKPLTILHMSDMHFTEFDQAKFDEFKKVVENLNQSIDIVTWGGDLLTHDDGFTFLQQTRELFRDIPIVCVLGNHDVYGDPVLYKPVKKKKRPFLISLLHRDHVYESSELRMKLREIGVTLLENENHEIQIRGSNIFFHGVKQPESSIPHTKPEGLQLDDEKLNILMVHRPDMREKMVEGFDLLVGGHTHGGQLSFPYIGAQVSNCQLSATTVSGHYRLGNTQWIVNNGFNSTQNTRVRLDCPRQISLLRIEEGIPGDLEEIQFKF